MSNMNKNITNSTSITLISFGIVSLCSYLLLKRLYKRDDIDLHYIAYLEEKLKQADQTIHQLNERLLHIEEDIQLDSQLVRNDNVSSSSQKPIRIWMDGVFDMMHYGHMNAFRQAKALGTCLIVGVNSNETIIRCKGTRPLTDDKERLEMVNSCRWVDEVVSDVPYIMNDEYLNYIFQKYKIDYIVHGDDPCIVDGKDVYETAKRLGKYLTIPRTEGISTTDIVGRMLLMTTSHHSLHNQLDKEIPNIDDESNHLSDDNHVNNHISPSYVNNKLISKRKYDRDRKSNFLTTSRIIRLFATGMKSPSRDDVIVYVPGTWDLFHSGHAHILQEAKKFGSYLVVGIYNDNAVNLQRGHNLPILNLHERVLSVMGCKSVDDVLFDAPFCITNELISSLNVSIVIEVSYEHENRSIYTNNDEDSELDQFIIPRQLNILHTLNIAARKVNVMDIVAKVQSHRDKYLETFKKKKRQEQEHFEQKLRSNISK